MTGLDPLVAQALALLLGAIAAAITSIVAYYFPRGYDRFDHEDGRKGKDDERET